MNNSQRSTVCRTSRRAPRQKKKVLFVCIHNSARSPIAEAILNKIAGDRFLAESAGLEAGELNPLAVRVLQEIGLDISGRPSRRVADFLAEGRRYDFVITVCDEASSQRCPVFPGAGRTLHWNFADPSRFIGSEEEKLRKIRLVRDQIYGKIEEWIRSLPRAKKPSQERLYRHGPRKHPDR